MGYLGARLCCGCVLMYIMEGRDDRVWWGEISGCSSNYLAKLTLSQLFSSRSLIIISFHHLSSTCARTQNPCIKLYKYYSARMAEERERQPVKCVIIINCIAALPHFGNIWSHNCNHVYAKWMNPPADRLIHLSDWTSINYGHDFRLDESLDKGNLPHGQPWEKRGYIIMQIMKLFCVCQYYSM